MQFNFIHNPNIPCVNNRPPSAWEYVRYVLQEMAPFVEDS